MEIIKELLPLVGILVVAVLLLGVNYLALKQYRQSREQGGDDRSME